MPPTRTGSLNEPFIFPGGRPPSRRRLFAANKLAHDSRRGGRQDNPGAKMARRYKGVGQPRQPAQVGEPIDRCRPQARPGANRLETGQFGYQFAGKLQQALDGLGRVAAIEAHLFHRRADQHVPVVAGDEIAGPFVHHAGQRGAAGISASTIWPAKRLQAQPEAEPLGQRPGPHAASQTKSLGCDRLGGCAGGDDASARPPRSRAPRSRPRSLPPADGRLRSMPPTVATYEPAPHRATGRMLLKLVLSDTRPASAGSSSGQFKRVEPLGPNSPRVENRPARPPGPAPRLSYGQDESHRSADRLGSMPVSSTSRPA